MKHKDMSYDMTKTTIQHAAVHRTERRLPARSLRRYVLQLALLLAAVGVKAQTANNAYIFYNATYGYLINNGGEPGVSTTFNKNAVWVATGVLGNTSRNINTYSASTSTKYYLTRYNNSLGFVTSEPTAYWRITNNYLRYRLSNQNNYYLKYTGLAFDLSNTQQSGNLFTATAITINNNNTTSNPTINITTSDGLTNGGIQLTGNVSGTYTPSYYYASIRNYNNANTQIYYWTETTNATTTQPSGITDWSDATKTWTVTTGGAYASVSTDGLVTITGNPTGNVVVTLTVSKGGYTGTQTITLTRTNVTEQAVSTYSPITVTPASTTLDVEGEQAVLTVSNSVTKTTTTTPAHIKFTAGDNDYYYYNNSLNSTPPTSSTSNTTLTFKSVSWVASGGDSYLYTLTPGYYSATSNEVTLTRTAAKIDTDQSFTLTAEAYYGDENLKQTASATVIIPKTFVDIGDLHCNNLTLAYGESGKLEPYSTYVIGGTGAPYLNVTYTIADPTIATVDENGEVTALKVGSTTVTIQSKKLDGNNGPAATANITVTPIQLPAPTITINDNGVATLTDNSGISGATIRYTTDGTPPTASTATTVASGGTVQLTRGQTIMALVTVDGGNYSPSPITTEIYVETGAFDGIVYLDDREDHNWSYYQASADLPDGYPDELHSPYPRNVKITYFGYGNNTLSTTDAAAPAANTFNVNTTTNDVKVGIGENENTFTYYKTLERDANGLYPYRIIFNPFYVRPKSGNTYTGFYKWRVKSITGGSISNAAGTTIATTNTTSTNNVWLNADETYYFNPSDNGETNVNNVTSMTVEFEALWAAAEVITSGSFSKGYNSVERNFYVRRNNATSNVFSSTTPCTYSSFYPNGTTNGTTAAAMGNRVSVQSGTAQADSKVEYHIWSNATALNTGGFKVDIGRGMTASGNGPSLTPLSGTHNSDKNARLRIETGAYNGGTSNLYGTPTVNNYLVHLDLIFGSDYDRAKGDNTLLTFANNNTIQHGAHVATGARWLSFQHLDIWVKSGRMQPGYFTDASASYNRTFYCRSTLENNNYPGISYLTVEGGEFASINGGRGNRTEGVALEDDIVFSLRIKGGIIHGSIYGAASANPSFGGRRVVMTGGMVEGWIAGGCDGTTSGGGATLGNSYFYIGGNAKVGNTANPSRRLDDTDGGNIFGAGRGRNNQGVSANPASMKNAFIAVADNGFVLRNVYGGGDYGYTGVVTFDGQTSDQTAANFFILGGTVNGAVHGGGNNNNSACTNANITMTGGLVRGGIYGGSNNSGTMAYNVNIKVNGGQVGTSSDNANIHGGGYGQTTRVNGNVDITLGAANQTEPGVTVYGDVYGGSALGTVNDAASDYTHVTMNKGIINGSLYGGALGSNTVAANVNGPVTVTVNGGTVNTTSEDGSGAVYGCNNINGAPQNTVAVIINGTDPAPDANTYALDAVYGGGNRASYSAGTPTVTVNNCDNSIAYVYGGGNAAHITNGNTDVTIYGGNKIGNVFGGGNGQVQAANISGNTNVKIYGGTIGKVFGGSNTQGTIGGTISVNVNKTGSCLMKVGEVYSGGNKATSNVGSITIGCTGDLTSEHASANDTDNRIGYELEGIGDLYGGSREANNTGNITLNITSGIINRVFGGNNLGGNVAGDIQVNINKTGDGCGWYVGDVFGGGNQAAYTKTPDVNIQNGTITRSVYGGGNEAGVAGGDVAMTGGTVLGGIYGGCNTSGTVTGNIVVNMTGGTVGTADSKAKGVFGGGYGQQTATDGNVDVNINGASLVIYGDVYGGSALGNVNSGTEDYTHVTLTAGTIHGDAYGGGLGDASNAALVKGNVTVTQNGVAFVRATTTDDEDNAVVTAGRIFGCNNLNGSPKGTVLVLVTKTARADGEGHTKSVYDDSGNLTTNNYEMAAVYGGGNLAAYNPTNPNATGQYSTNHTATGKPIQVVINGCTEASIEYVYGGGNAAATPATDVLILGAYEIGYVFGGGNGKDKYSLDGGTTWKENDGADVGIIDSDAYEANPSTGIYGTGESLASLLGGTIHNAFGGSNTKGNVREEAKVYLNESDENDEDYCPLKIDEVYGGGNEAPMEGDSQIELGCISYLKEIYGGSKAADLGGNIVLTITSGTFDRVFGGNNLDGEIAGSITVNIEETGCHPIIIGELYGCGNQASYSTPEGKSEPTINVKSFTSIGRIFGGGYGEGAVVTGNPTIYIDEIDGKFASEEYDGETKTISGNDVTLPAHAANAIGAIGTVFGGGNAADVEGNPNVYIGTKSTISYVSGDDHADKAVKGVNITGNVFGGGNAAVVTGDTNVVIGR